MQHTYIDGSLFKKMLKEAAVNLEANKKTVDDLNVFPVPDGDTGTNMSLTLRYAAQEISDHLEGSLSDMTSIASSGALMGARGNSGVILSQLLRGFAKACKGKKELSLEDVSIALQSASDMAYKAVMKPTEGTILTVAREMSSFAMSNHTKYESVELFLPDIIAWGKETLDKTPEMLPVLKEAGVVDAGGMGLIYIMEGALNGLTGKVSSFQQPEIDWEKPVIDRLESPEDLKYGYCTEFIIIGKNDEKIREDLKSEYDKIGDSIIVVGDEEKIKVHLHTDNPDQALGLAFKIGSLTRIKIDNMREQVGERRHLEEKRPAESKIEKYGVISVASGEGLKTLFADLGAKEVIMGGQTMNPSTQDFIEAINRMNAENIIILPNNSNIILAANQTKEISEKNIIVIPTKTIPQGITSLLSFDADKSMEENIETMTEVIKMVKTGQVTYAVRDTSFNGKEIKKDDIIGIIDNEIVCLGDNPDFVLLDIVDRMADESSELISVYYGSAVEESDAKKLILSIEEKYSGLDVELHNGGQPLYYYIVSVE